MRYIESLKEMVTGKDNKVVYLPYEATAALGALGGIKEMFGNVRLTKDTTPPTTLKQEIRFNCEKCGQALSADASAKGSSITCPSCGVMLLVP